MNKSILSPVYATFCNGKPKIKQTAKWRMSADTLLLKRSLQPSQQTKFNLFNFRRKQMLLRRNMAAPGHLLQRNNMHMQRVHVVLHILASSAVLLIWNSWPSSCSSSCSGFLHSYERNQTATERCQGCAGRGFVCLFSCLYERCAAVTPRRMTVLTLQWIWFVYLFPFFYSNQKTKM